MPEPLLIGLFDSIIIVARINSRLSFRGNMSFIIFSHAGVTESIA